MHALVVLEYKIVINDQLINGHAVFDRMTIFGCSLKKMVTGTMLV